MSGRFHFPVRDPIPLWLEMRQAFSPLLYSVLDPPGNALEGGALSRVGSLRENLVRAALRKRGRPPSNDRRRDTLVRDRFWPRLRAGISPEPRSRIGRSEWRLLDSS